MAAAPKLGSDMTDSGMFRYPSWIDKMNKALYLPRVKRSRTTKSVFRKEEEAAEGHPNDESPSTSTAKHFVSASRGEKIIARSWRDFEGNTKREATDSAQIGTSLISLSMVIHASWHHGSFVWHQDAAAWDQRQLSGHLWSRPRSMEH